MRLLGPALFAAVVISSCNAGGSDPTLASPIAAFRGTLSSDTTSDVQNVVVTCTRDIPLTPADQANGVKRIVAIGGTWIVKAAADPSAAWQNSWGVSRYVQKTDGNWYLDNPPAMLLKSTDAHQCTLSTGGWLPEMER
jgi:hypothetical protein